MQLMTLMNQLFLINQIERPTKLKLKNFFESDLNQTSESSKGVIEFTDDSLTESRVILLLSLIQTYERTKTKNHYCDVYFSTVYFMYRLHFLNILVHFYTIIFTFIYLRM